MNSSTSLNEPTNAVVVTHLGLGDHIICNGMIREFSTQFANIITFTTNRNIKNVMRMFSDVHNLYIHEVSDATPITDTQIAISQEYNKCLLIDTSIYGNYGSYGDKRFDEVFYEKAGIPFEKRFSSFFVPRNHENEQKVMEMMGVKKQTYAFVHDDPSRGFLIPSGVCDSICQSGLRVIKNNPALPLFDMRFFLENAKEIHCMPSSICDFCNSIDLPGVDIFVYPKLRHYGKFHISHSKNPRVIR